MRPVRGIAAALFALSALAGEQPARAAPAEGQAFIAKFREAAAQPGGDALADLTALPFLFESQPRGRAEFVARVVPALFTPAVRNCLKKAVPQPEDGRLVVWCKPYAFYFGAAQGRWRLEEFGADGE